VYRFLQAFFLFSVAAVAQPEVSITPRQRQSIPEQDKPIMRINVRQVMVPAVVTDANNRLFRGLKAENFRLLEDGVEQKINSFSVEEVPLSMGIVFDASSSMKGKLEVSVAAAKQVFLNGSPADEFSLVQFGDGAELASGFTNHGEAIQARLAQIRANGWTALIDGAYLALNEMRHSHNPRKVLLILSDGENNNSRYGENELLSFAKEAEVSIYSVRIGRTLARGTILEKLAAETGGRQIVVDNATGLAEAVRKMDEMMRHQYMLGYVSSAPNDGKRHNIKLELILSPSPSIPKLRITWRRGYMSLEP